MKNFNSIYKSKKIFLTGHTGFKGSWLLAWLNAMGAIVKGYSLAPQNSFDLYNLINGDALCQSILADIRDKDRLKQEILDFEPDFVFHLAAQPLVRYSYEIPEETFETNAIGTANVLNALRFLKKNCAVIIITTDKVYENKDWQYPYREIDRLGGYDPYSASKAAAELVISSFQNCYFNINKYSEHNKAIAVARAGNVIGGGDWAKDRIIPDIIRSLQNHKPIEIRNPKAIRPWQHVIEPLSGYLLLGQKLTENPIMYATAWNFGPQQEDAITVEEVAKNAIAIWGEGSISYVNAEKQFHEARILRLDISKAINELGWRPLWDAKKAIAETVNFYKSANEKPLQYLQKQIEQYCK